MEEENGVFVPPPPPSSTTHQPILSSSSLVQEQREEEQQHRQQQQPSGVSYSINFRVSNFASTDLRNEIWAGLIVLVTFWSFASMTLILGFYGSLNLRLGPNCSRLLQVNSLFVQSLKAVEIEDSSQGAVLYGVYEPPPLDVEITWAETHNAFVQSSSHKEWQYYLNKGSKVDISYSVKSQSTAPILLVISQGRESLLEWIEDPLYPNTTLSWNIIHGNGSIQQDILSSKSYYIALGSLNTEEVEVQLNFSVKAFVYNTSKAYYKCSLSHGECELNLFLLRTNAAILTSPSQQQGMANGNWYVKLSYGPRWITYFVGSGFITLIIMFAFKIASMCQIDRRHGDRLQGGETGSVQASLLSQKDDLSSLGSSYDSLSQDEEEIDKLLAAVSPNGLQREGAGNDNPQNLCVICFDAPRDCFFLPCGHSAACFTCGTRIIEEGGSCPICRRKMKKVRKIFAV